ncbi:hypothetical protein HERIO_514 [Hepatospora eriocheir]|uniref:Transmembrane protein n=1 Tax=Hepatospora eriocheir TaxID=1081669 RepID=A0A1X0QD48_9MICR|nr:hypothetical protein HERIO_514 [Hepatospora eriocheir]
MTNQHHYYNNNPQLGQQSPFNNQFQFNKLPQQIENERLTCFHMYRMLIKWMTYILIVLFLVLLFFDYLERKGYRAYYTEPFGNVFLIYLYIYLCLYFLYFLLSCCNDNKNIIK